MPSRTYTLEERDKQIYARCVADMMSDTFWRKFQKVRREGRRERKWRRAFFNRVALYQRPERSEKLSRAHTKRRKGQMQRPRGKGVLGNCRNSKDARAHVADLREVSFLWIFPKLEGKSGIG